VASLLHYSLKKAAHLFADLHLDRGSGTQDACAAQSNRLVLRLTREFRRKGGSLCAAYQTTGTLE
jgi:hypothetical protein